LIIVFFGAFGAEISTIEAENRLMVTRGTVLALGVGADKSPLMLPLAGPGEGELFDIALLPGVSSIIADAISATTTRAAMETWNLLILLMAANFGQSGCLSSGCPPLLIRRGKPRND
jgi:hypothetical protein